MSHGLNSTISVIGIDIGKNSFHVVGLDGRGSIVLRQKWSRGSIATFRDPCQVRLSSETHRRSEHPGSAESCQQWTCRFIVRFHFGCTPAASSASCQNVCCDRRNVPNSLGVPPTTVANASVIPDRIFGS